MLAVFAWHFQNREQLAMEQRKIHKQELPAQKQAASTNAKTSASRKVL
jgi:hypothetical protein